MVMAMVMAVYSIVDLHIDGRAVMAMVMVMAMYWIVDLHIGQRMFLFETNC